MKILKYLLLFIICLFLFVVIGVNILKYPYYHNYYSILTKLGRNPGLNEGFVPQGITFFNNHFITTGYMGTKTIVGFILLIVIQAKFLIFL